MSEKFLRAYPSWNASVPANLAAARAAELAVRARDAIPATIAVIDGVVCVGLTDDQLVRLAAQSDPLKISLRDLGPAIAFARTGGTTVASTSLIACAAGIQLFATGGIGGVHRGWSTTLDISADLNAIATNRVVVVCAGAKILLDLPATLEALEALGIPALGYRTGALPRFTVEADPELLLPEVVHSPAEIAAVVAAHWTAQPTRGALVMQPCPESFALSAQPIEVALAAALEEAKACGVRGAATTPFLLARLAACESGNQVLEANLALLFANATLAAQVATALAR